jgi:hypothetical protein
VVRALESLQRKDWIESAPRVRKYREWLLFAKRPTAKADQILSYRGTITLTVQVSPYAELRGPLLDGIAAGERFTPFMKKEIEIRDGALELVHPELGTHAVALPALKNGASITIEGSLKDPKSIQTREGP